MFTKTGSTKAHLVAAVFAALAAVGTATSAYAQEELFLQDVLREALAVQEAGDEGYARASSTENNEVAEEELFLRKWDNYAEEQREKRFLENWAGYVTKIDLDQAVAEIPYGATGNLRAGRLNGANPFGMLNNAITGITGAWSKITSAFGSSYKEELVGQHFDNGWKKFKAATKTFKGTGLPKGRLGDFMNHIADQISLPGKYRGDFNQVAEWIGFFDSSTWSQHNTQFKQGNGGSDTSFTMFANNRDDGKVDVLFMTCKQQFKLAKDFLVISQSKSMLGGLFSSTQIKIKKMDAGLKDRDLQFVSSYFSLLAYQQVALAEGLQVPPDPSFPQSEEELLLQNWDNYAEEQREKRL